MTFNLNSISSHFKFNLYNTEFERMNCILRYIISLYVCLYSNVFCDHLDDIVKSNEDTYSYEAISKLIDEKSKENTLNRQLGYGGKSLPAITVESIESEKSNSMSEYNNHNLASGSMEAKIGYETIESSNSAYGSVKKNSDESSQDSWIPKDSSSPCPYTLPNCNEQTETSEESDYETFDKESDETSMDSSRPQNPSNSCNYMQPDCNGGTETSEKQEPIDCQWGPWQITRCNRSCGKGLRTKTRRKIVHERNGGHCHGKHKKLQPCRIRRCPINCKWSAWRTGSCSTSCGPNRFRTNTRTKTRMERFGGACLGAPKTRKQCRPIPCPVDGFWLNWISWGRCTLSCGGGIRTRTRTCNPPRNNGRQCSGPSSQTNSCPFRPCPVNGSWRHWGSWSSCSRSCGGGRKKRSRSCKHPRHGGNPCRGQSSDSRSCKHHSCPIDGTWHHWRSWGGCSRTCGGGTKRRSRSCNGPRHGGRHCIGSTSDSRSCNTHSCPSRGKCKLLGIFSLKLGPCFG